MRITAATAQTTPPKPNTATTDTTPAPKISVPDQAGGARDSIVSAWPWSGKKSDLPTVASVDLSRYAGKWYELARLPVRFQDKRSVSTAEYSLNPDGTVKVVNTAYIGDKTDARIVGKARSVNPGENSRLRVGFGGLLRFIPTPKQGNYWIVDLKSDYSMALVGTPDRRFLWLLARDKDAWGSPDAKRFVERASSLGFDTSRLQVADWATRLIRQQSPAQES